MDFVFTTTPNVNIYPALPRRFDIRLQKRDEKALLKAGAIPHLVFFDTEEEDSTGYRPRCAELYWMVPCYSSYRKLFLPFTVTLMDGIKGQSLVCVNGVRELFEEVGPFVDIFDKNSPPRKLKGCQWHITYQALRISGEGEGG